MPFNFSDGSTIEVVPPNVPVIKMAPPPPATVVLPVGGPPGPQGPPGDTGQTLAFVQNVSTPQSTILINHDLAFNPQPLAIDSQGATVTGWTITYPNPGWIEMVGGVSFTGTVYLS